MAELVEAAEVVEEVVGKAFSSRDFGLGATVGRRGNVNCEVRVWDGAGWHPCSSRLGLCVQY